jgi:hypothetical protein
MRTIPLTQGYEALVDDEDYEELSKYRWCAEVTPYGIVYAARSVRDEGRRYTVRMHRQVLHALTAGFAVKIDHANHNGLDNRKTNLKVCTNAENGANRAGVLSRSGTGVRNVGFHKQTGKYRVMITKDYIIKEFGEYTTLEEASRVAEAARKELFGL